MDGPISARRRLVGPRRCRTMGSPTPLTIVITNNPRTADTATINGRTVAKCRYIILDRYPLPALTTFNERLAGCSVFSKIDLRQAFQQVHVDEASQDKMAIITTLGLFKFLRMPYGLKNAAQCFQRNVHQLLSDMPFAHFLYMDDLIVGSKCKEDHVRDLQCLFQRLKDKGLLLNKNKCQLGEPSLTFLGHVVDSRGISIPTERVEAIKRFPVPTTPK